MDNLMNRLCHFSVTRSQCVRYDCPVEPILPLPPPCRRIRAKRLFLLGSCSIGFAVSQYQESQFKRYDGISLRQRWPR
jgi:hypothetical protein